MVEATDHRCEDFTEVRHATLEAPYHFTDSGLPNVYLAGIRYFVCKKCGKRAAEIPAVKELMREIARTIVEKEAPLTGPQIRFLRKRLGKTGADFARIVGVVPEEVSRWENNANSREKSADKLIRVYYSLLSDDKRLREKLRVEAFEAWLAAIPSGAHIAGIQAAFNRKHEWKVQPVAA
jgi:putative zinc finger/helix-turn-helix YgiT family protein